MPKDRTVSVEKLMEAIKAHVPKGVQSRDMLLMMKYDTAEILRKSLKNKGFNEDRGYSVFGYPISLDYLIPDNEIQVHHPPRCLHRILIAEVLEDGNAPEPVEKAVGLPDDGE